jgi:hypothetical protein
MKTRAALLLVAGVVLAAATSLWARPPRTTPQTAGFSALKVEKIEARFQAHPHDPAAPGKCGESRLDLSFEVKNSGPTAVATNGLGLYWRTNRPGEAWPARRTQFIKPPAPGEVVTGWSGEFLLPKEMKSGESATYTFSPKFGPQVGRWHPILVEARLRFVDFMLNTGEFHDQGLDGDSRTFDFGVPDVRVPPEGFQIFTARNEKGVEMLGARIQVESTGAPFDGVLGVSVEMVPDPEKVKLDRFKSWRGRRLTLNEVLKGGLAGTKTLLTPPKAFSSEVLEVKNAWLRVALGCAEHGPSNAFWDANPANNRETRTVTLIRGEVR